MRADKRGIRLGALLAFVATVALALGSGAQAATPCAELAVTNVAFTPAQPLQGVPTNVAVTVQNSGTCAATGFDVQWKPDFFNLAGPSVPVAGLAAGASAVVNLPYVFPQPGTFLSFAIVDPTNTVAETNEWNNFSLKLVSAASSVDLVVSNVSIDPSNPVQGAPASVSVTVTNQGLSAAGPFRVDWSPAFLAPASSQQVAGLAAGASTTLTFAHTYGSAGTVDSVAVVDAGSAVAEANEFNNAKSLRMTVIPPLPDLVVADVVTSPSPAVINGLTTAAITVTNDGLAPAGSFQVQWRPWLLATPVSVEVDGLATGASVTVNLSYVFDFAGQFAGTVTVDSTGAVSEIIENNNTRATQVNAAQATLAPSNIAQGGFGDYQNSYSWSMAWFKGKLYVGTARSFHCVESVTLDFYYPGYGFYNGYLDGLPEANCPASYYDLDLRAEIWQYTPETGVWKRVYQSPTVPNPRAPGKNVARDIGYRGMVVYTEPSGEQALYVGGVTADEYIPELAEAFPPRILRSGDGETFTPLPTGPGLIHNTFGAQRPIGFRAMAVFDGRLFATASGGLGGDGVILEVKDPWGPSPTYVQVSPDTMQVYEMEPFNGSLYIGISAASGGYSVLKLVNPTTIPFEFTPVVTGGGGRPAITSVVSMHVYKERLYIGSNGWGQGAGAEQAAEEIRINPDDTWDLVAGKARTLPGGIVKSPISGLGDGFGNSWNAHLWRAETHNGAMYIGTNDASGAWQAVQPLGALLAPEFGFDVWGTCDGQYWWQVTRNAFGNGGAGQWDFGARTLVSSPFGLFIGSTNHVQGTKVWKGDASPCGAAGGGTFGLNKSSSRADGSSGSSGALLTPGTGTTAGRVSLPSPTRLLADVQACGTALSWDRAPGATRYRILRSDYRTAKLNDQQAPRLLGDFTLDRLAAEARLSRPSKGGRVWIAGAYTSIGTTTKSSFVDQSAKPGTRYNYEVVAESASGQSSQASNIATVPSQAPKVTFSQLNAAVKRLASATNGKATGQLLRLATAARTSWSTDRATSLRVLTRLRNAVETTGAPLRRPAGPVARSDVMDAIFQLERRARLDAVCTR